MNDQTHQKVSPVSYTVAVCLAGIFGILGIHHFYVGRIVMGIFDLSLSVLGFGLVFVADNPLGWLFIAIDALHTVIVTYWLLVGEYHDGQGRIIAYPGQKL